MKFQANCLAVALLALASCSKSEKEDKSEKQTNAENTRATSQRQSPSIAEKLAPDRAAQSKAPTDPPAENVPAIRPKGISSSDKSWEQLSAQKKLEQFQADGIARVPQHVSKQIVSNAANQSPPDDQVRFISQQAAAWHHVDQFRSEGELISDSHKQQLLDTLQIKHGDSWQLIAAELDEQVAACNQVMDLRWDGIPGMTDEESENLIMNAIGSYMPDYKAVLDVVSKSAK